MGKRSAPPETTCSQGWMVTFSDCMTLLLTFFVLLLTFSSFDKQAKGQLAGAFRAFSRDSIFEDSDDVSSAVEESPTSVDWTAEGSDKPLDHEPEMTRNPKRYESIERGAHANQQVLHLVSEAQRSGHLQNEGLFLGAGSVLTSAGKGKLNSVAEYLRKLPCRVTVGESRVTAGSEDEKAQELSIARCEAVVAYLSAQGGVPLDSFSISMPSGQAAQRRGGPVMEITLLARGMYP